MSRPRARRQMLFALMLILLLLVVFEALARVAIVALSGSPLDFRPIHERHAEMHEQLRELVDAQARSLLQVDPELGWIYASDHRGQRYSSNSQGARGRREYARERPPGTLRVAAFGDSFVHANEVADEESWSARLEARDPRLEVLNFGVGGFGSDQALLYYERLRDRFDPQVVVLGFSELNYARNLNRFRRFRTATGLPQSKPRFVLDDSAESGLELVANPFPGIDSLRVLLSQPDAVNRAGEHDWFYEPAVWRNPIYDFLASVRLLSTTGSWLWRARLHPGRLFRAGRLNVDSEAFAILVGIVDRFAERVEADGRHFVFMIFPVDDSDIWGPENPVYEPLLDVVSKRHEVLDLRHSLLADPEITPENLRMPGKHYGAAGNLAVARALEERLFERGWLSVP